MDLFWTLPQTDVGQFKIGWQNTFVGRYEAGAGEIYDLDHSPDGSVVVTAFAGELDVATGRLRYASAGHEPPLLARAADASCGKATAQALAPRWSKISRPAQATQISAG